MAAGRFAAQHIQREVRRRSMEPTAQILSDLGWTSHQTEKCFLGGILSPGAVPQNSQTGCVNATGILMHDARKRLGIPPIGPSLQKTKVLIGCRLWIMGMKGLGRHANRSNNEDGMAGRFFQD
jgi:hypothetical protein